MKKFFILLALSVAVIACKNDSKTESANTSPASEATTQTSAQPAVDLAAAGTALKNAKTTVEEIKNLRQQIDALPDNVKKANAGNIENLRSTLEGLEEKETYFINELDKALSASNAPAGADGAADQTAAIQDATQSLKTYEEDLKSAKEQIKALSGKQ